MSPKLINPKTVDRCERWHQQKSGYSIRPLADLVPTVDLATCETRRLSFACHLAGFMAGFQEIWSVPFIMARGMQRLEERGCTRLHPPNPIHIPPSTSHDPHPHPNPQSPSTSTSISWFISWDLPLLPIVRCPFLIRKGCGRAAGRSNGWAACETSLGCTRPLLFVCRGCEMQQTRLRLLPKLSLLFSELFACVSDLGGGSDRLLLFLGAEIFGASERTQVRSLLVVLELANGVAWVEVGTVNCLFSWRDEDLVCYNKLFRKAKAR